MIDRGYIFIPYDTLLYALPYKNATYSIFTKDTQLRRAYDGVLTITMDQGEQNFYEAFKEAQDSYEIHNSAEPDQVRFGGGGDTVCLTLFLKLEIKIIRAELGYTRTQRYDSIHVRASQM